MNRSATLSPIIPIFICEGNEHFLEDFQPFLSLHPRTAARFKFCFPFSHPGLGFPPSPFHKYSLFLSRSICLSSLGFPLTPADGVVTGKG
ncbi:hypothetical protein L1987_08772 [Smallanthus sonchifolius]|uniref:Uncharacterized protein n=1 Tax=Smallanthus sonchifolius TaxID=185202 RepID=A0ACB9JLJ1_9ASTR|nr:hypothetical protein L1987_08772 [Smallanthus sonchifolius]